MVREPHHERAGSQRDRQTVRLTTTLLPAHPEALEGRAERQRPAMVVVGKGSGQKAVDSRKREHRTLTTRNEAEADVKYPITDAEEVRLQEAYNQALHGVEQWIRGERQHALRAVDVSVERPGPFVLTEDNLDSLDTFDEERDAWNEWNRTLTELRAYRASKERDGQA